MFAQYFSLIHILECPKADGKFRDPFNNSVYIECVNGTGTRMECPFPGQYWEDKIKDCMFPRKYI